MSKGTKKDWKKAWQIARITKGKTKTIFSTKKSPWIGFTAFDVLCRRNAGDDFERRGTLEMRLEFFKEFKALPTAWA